MYHKNSKFILDDKRRLVFDENNKELRLTGNAYRLLVFLCKQGSATLTEIGDYLDWAKDYNENHLRQYRYKINSIIGHDVIEYQNGVYLLIGDVKKCKKLPKNNRNTDLLHSNKLKYKLKESKKMLKPVSFTIYPAVFASIMLTLTFFNWPSGYYTFLRIIVTGVAVYYLYYLYSSEKRLNIWFWMLVLIAIIFNPIFPIYLYDKSLWIPIDIATVALLLSFLIKIKVTAGKKIN